MLSEPGTMTGPGLFSWRTLGDAPNLFRGDSSLLQRQNLFGELSTACDFVDLVQPGDYSVTAFPAQNGFFTPPVVHYRGRLGTVLHFAHFVSATYPSAKQVLT